VGLVLAGLNVFVRDTAQMLTIGLQVAFWLNPIVYFKEFIPAFDPRTPLGELNGFEWGGRLLLMLNPVERFVSASQWLVGESPHAPGWVDWGVICGGPAICLVGGYLLFRRMLPQVRDCL
jgi:lipopolysaccharide transport system permease protein